MRLQMKKLMYSCECIVILSIIVSLITVHIWKCPSTASVTDESKPLPPESFDKSRLGGVSLTNEDLHKQMGDDSNTFMRARDTKVYKPLYPGSFDKSRLGGVSLTNEDLHIQMEDDPNTFMRDFKKPNSTIQVLCWVLTSPTRLKNSIHVKNTWARRCDQLLFFSSETNSKFPTIGLPVPEGHDKLSEKTFSALEYMYNHYLNQADWFLKADDDTYVIMENLKLFLSGKSPNDLVYYGHHFNALVKQGFHSGGAGYVISKAALKKFGDFGKKNCNNGGVGEDVEIGKCFEKLGVEAGKSVDSQGRSRFHCFHPELHVVGQYPSWYFEYDTYHAKMGERSMSDSAISFHYITPSNMYMLEYFIYHLHVHQAEVK
ncbi:glycoprotein-N-acetylgalactosamine 3-beta-galactosyltransferase 1 [Mactra antiquata]